MFDLTEEQRMLKEAIGELGVSEIAPNAHEWDEAEITPEGVIGKVAELGLFGIRIPESYGGAGCDLPTYTVAIEELARWSASVAIVVAVHNSVAVAPLLGYGTDEQKERYLPKLGADLIGCFCLTEPGSGSDAASLRATAKRDGDDYVLNGAKVYVTNGDIAGLFVVFAKTDPSAGHRGISAFLVDRGTPGLVLGTKEKKMGLRASGTMEVVLEDCRVPASNRLGDEGVGFKIAMSALDGGRIGVGAQACGVARAALEESIRYATEREQFGKPIAEHQAIQQKLASMSTELDAAWALVMRAAHLYEKGGRVTREASEAKLFASEMAQRVASEAVQIHGGYGYIRDYAVERYYRDARVMSLYEGTSEIQRLVIARELLKS
jgi:alkylation response protein AidB-like acyl-CoA dehydrogenase